MRASRDRNADRNAGRDLGAEVAVRLRGLRDAPTRRLRSMGFPYTSAPTPRGVEPPAQPQVLGDAYDTEWARRPIARWSRLAALATVGRGVVELTCRPRLLNADRIEDLDAPAVFVANHHSHLDTALLLSTLPRPWRHELVVAAAADYFFDTRPKAALAAWAYGAVPMERRKVSRRSADRAAALIEDGWSLLIFPEGGRSPDGWGQDHKGGAAYLAVRCGVPVVPIHLDGTGRVLPKGSSRPSPESVTINIGTPLHALDGEDARSVAPRIEAAIDALADESSSDWYSARRRAHAASTPSLKGPETDSWRRDWTAPDRRPRARDEERWPDLGGR